MNDITPTDNSPNSQVEPKPTLIEVDSLANEICTEYSNHDFYRWYCKVINVLGVRRVNEIRSMYRDARQARHLFSKRASEEMKVKLAQQKLINLRNNNGKISS